MLPVRDVRTSFVDGDRWHGIPSTLVRARTEYFSVRMSVIVAAVIVCLAGVCPAQGQWATPQIEHGQSTARQSLIVPGTDYEVLVGKAERKPNAAPSPALLRAIVFWLSTTFELPPHDALPRIEFAAASKITAL